MSRTDIPESESALELTRRSFEAADSGDYDRMMSFYGPESVFDMADWGLGVHTGPAAIRTFFEAWIGAFDEFEMKLVEMRYLGDSVVFAVARQRALQARARTPLQLEHAAIAVWSDGVAVRVTNYRDIDRAREIAAGMDAGADEA
jgi:ketosteroid isomerase-like protein